MQGTPNDLPPHGPPDVLDLLARLDASGRQVGALQEQLVALRTQLAESHRLATVGTIAAVIAHEFNNLLTPMISYSQYALRGVEQDAPDLSLIRKALAKSYQGATKAGKICSAMLGLARGERSPALVSVRQIVDESLAVLARDPKQDGIALRVQVPPDLYVRADPTQIEQVLLNLLINARHAMLGRGGSLTIRAVVEAGALRLCVSDTGPGIPPELLGRIFDPFFTTKTAEETPRGSGLGLAICRDIIEHHGGTIAVASRLRQGTTFDIRLPLAHPQVADDAPPPNLTRRAA